MKDDSLDSRHAQNLHHFLDALMARSFSQLKYEFHIPAEKAE